MISQNVRLLLALTVLFASQLTVPPRLSAQAIDPNGIPDEIHFCLRANKGLEIDAGINPYYVTGDFDGDGTIDFAVLVRNPKDQGVGIHHILFCFAQGKSVLWDAGEQTNEDSPFTAWFLVPKQSKQLSVYPKIKHDSVALLIGEAGGGLIYWNGRKFLWQQEE